MESLRAENEAITKYQFNKEQIAVSLSLLSSPPLSPALSLFFFFFCWKNDKSLSVPSECPLKSQLFMSEVGGWDILNPKLVSLLIVFCPRAFVDL